MVDFYSLTPDPEGLLDAPLLDAEYLAVFDAFIKGDRQAFLRIVQRFKESMAALLKELAVATERRDLHRIAEIAHTLKGNGATFGLERLRRLAARMEVAAHQGALSTVRDYVPLMEEAYGAALPVLEQTLGQW